MLNELRQYEGVHGDARVTADRERLVQERLDAAYDKQMRANQVSRARMDALRAWVAEHGLWNLPTHHNKDPLAAGIGRWLHRLRQQATTGRLDPETAAGLKAIGIHLTTPPDTAVAEQARRQVDTTFERKIALLRTVIDRIEAGRGVRNITRADSLASDDAEEAYRYLAYMIRKSRNGVLDDGHQQRILELKFNMNGTPFGELLARKSMRLVPGGARGEVVFGLQSDDQTMAPDNIANVKPRARRRVPAATISPL